MKISIGFSAPKGIKLGAEAIKLYIGKPYSHVYVKFEYDDVTVVFQASHGKVHFSEFGIFQEKNKVLKEIPIKYESKKEEIETTCYRLAGIDYGYLDLPIIVLNDLLLKTKTGLSLPYDGPGYVCSGLVGIICTKHLGISFNKPDCLLKPDDIEMALTNCAQVE